MKDFVVVKENAWLIEELLTLEECQDLIDEAVAAGMQSQHVVVAQDCLRVELDDASLSATV